MDKQYYSAPINDNLSTLSLQGESDWLKLNISKKKMKLFV